jgi:uncharacterized protein (TIGR02453 family)
MSRPYFTRRTFTFLSALAENNDRLWFEEHRQEYEDHVRGPALDFISDMAKVLPSISPHFRAVPKKAGGSLMRVQRNLRFSRDKTPYKTNIGIQFRHELARDVHAPGFYLHIEPGECFVGAGLWRPEPDALLRIRQAIAEHGEEWVAVRDDRRFRRHFTLSGETLVNVPRGFARDHPLAGDLRRKDFVGLAKLGRAEVLSGDLVALSAERFRAAAPVMRFLCAALALRF